MAAFLFMLFRYFYYSRNNIFFLQSGYMKFKLIYWLFITPENFSVTGLSVNGMNGPLFYNIPYLPDIKISFSAPVNKSLVANTVLLRMNGSILVPVNYAYQNGDSSIVIHPQAALNPITKYIVTVTADLKSASNTQNQKNF